MPSNSSMKSCPWSVENSDPDLLSRYDVEDTMLGTEASALWGGIRLILL